MAEMMQAIVCKQWGEPAALEFGQLPRPNLADGAVRLRVAACSINFADVLMVQGLYQEKPPFPFAPGMEVSGEIAETAGGVTHLRPGQRVMAMCGHGGLAAEVVVPAAAIVPIPDSMPFHEAAAFAVAYGTSHVALTHRGRLQPGETLLVHGAAGGVGLAAVEIGKQLGARVIATASTAEKLDLARASGADAAINYTTTDFVAAVKELTGGRGADVIFDPVGGEVFTRSLRCIAWEGRLLVVGFASGSIPAAPANLALLKNCSIVGTYWGAYLDRAPEVIRQSLAQLLSWYEEGSIRPHVAQIFPFERAAEALITLQERRAVGKVVVQVNPAV